MDCALGGGLRASPSAPMCAKTPNGVGCGHRPSREHGRPAPRPRVRPFPATIDPAGTSASADCCRVTGCLSATGVGRINFPRPTSRQPSPDKTSDLPRTPTASTLRPLDGIGLRHAKLARPDRPALYAQPTRTPKGPGAPCVPRVAILPPASFPPRLATTQLPLARGWCHQPPQGTFTPSPLVMPGVLGSPGASQPPAPTDPGVTVSRHRALLIGPSTRGPRASG
jgi:hypothetical protein